MRHANNLGYLKGNVSPSGSTAQSNKKARAEAQKRYRASLTTEIVPLTKFWPAEDYHQDYFRKNPNAGYCRVVIAPKIMKLEHQLAVEKH